RENWGEYWGDPGRGARTLICLPPASGKRYRGTADAVFQNLPLITSKGLEHVLILSGDHVYEMDYREILSQHVERNADVTIATIEHPVEDAGRFGVVEVDPEFRVTGFQEKPETASAMPLRPSKALISMGVYVFKRDVLIRALIENCDDGLGFDFGRHIIPSLIDASRVYAYGFCDDAADSPRYWRDIGTIDSYYEANMDLLGMEPLFNPYLKGGWHWCPGLAKMPNAQMSVTADV